MVLTHPRSLEEEKKDKEDDFAYEVLTPDDVMARPLQLIEEVNEVLQVHPMLARQGARWRVVLRGWRSGARTVLQYFNWNKENAVQRYFMEQEKIFKEAKLPRPELMKSLADMPNKVTCTICFDECAKKDVDSLPCGHIFCKLCWRDYLLVKVQREGTAAITCPATGCGLCMDEGWGGVC